MEFVGKPITGQMLRNVHGNSIRECIELKVAIPYAQQGNEKIRLFEDALVNDKKLTFFGRLDGTCPIDLDVLKWFLDLKSPNATCRLVPHWLHAKVIWWVGQGAYIGSANLTERAWNQNYEAGLFLSHEELEHFGLTLQLESFFAGLDANSVPLCQEEYEKQVKLSKQRDEILKKLRQLEAAYEDSHKDLRERQSPLSVDRRQTRSKQIGEFAKEWDATLQQIRDIGSRISRAENRPAWISADVPSGVQADQFLHAYYYQRVKPTPGRDSYSEFFERHRRNPEAALAEAIEWWRSGNYRHDGEEETIYDSAPVLREALARDKIMHLTEDQWVDALRRVHALGDHAIKFNNSLLGLGAEPGAHAKVVAFAKRLFHERTIAGSRGPREVLMHVIWGQGDVAERIWDANHDADWKLPHVGVSMLGEILGWARPTEFPPRNMRTSKALRSLGYEVAINL